MEIEFPRNGIFPMEKYKPINYIIYDQQEHYKHLFERERECVYDNKSM